MRQKRPRLFRIARVRARQILRRVERSSAAWALIVTPWGTSLLLHALMLLLLGIYFYVYVGRDERPRGLALDTSFAPQLVEDLTSLQKGDQSGDPFTTLQSVEPPSLSLQPAPVQTDIINVPELPSNMQLAPTLQLNSSISRRDSGKSDEGLGQLAMNVGPMSAPFSGRQGETKAKLIRREGGTVESEKAVERGLDWIARHQRPDGGWSLDTRGQCRGTGCPEDRAMISDTAATGLALLPMLGAGLSHTQPSRYQDNIKRGLSWLLHNQSRSGDMFVGGGYITHLYSHAIATMALCEAYGVSKDKRLRDPAQRAINFIVGAQNQLDGGWRYEPGARGDTSVFGWQIFALRSARLAGLTIPKGTLQRCRLYLDQAATDDSGTTYGYMPGREATPVMTSEALLGRQILGWARDYPPMLQGAAMISAHLEDSQQRNIYYWYYATQLLHNLQGKDWEKWNKRVRDGLISMQVDGTGCDKGSWDPLHPQPDQWGQQAGRLYVTSLSLLTLEVYYRYLPLYRARDDKLEGNDQDMVLEKVEAAAAAAKADADKTPAPRRSD